MPDFDARQRALEATRETLSKTLDAIKSERIAKWKSRMSMSAKKSGKLAYKWMRGDVTKQCALLQRGDGKLTGNPDEIMDILNDKWMPVFRRYSDQPEPSPDAFLSEYRDEVAKLTAGINPPSIQPLGATDLKGILSKMNSDTAPGLDGWTVTDLKMLPDSCLSTLAILMQAIENTGKWPQALSIAKVTLIPKSDGSADPGAQRPITVMSVVYRLWASTRLHQCEDWQAEYLPWHMHGFCKSRCVEDGIWQASMRIEEANASSTPLYGFSMDIAKAFDSVPHAVMFHLAKKVGVPTQIIRGLQAMYAGLNRRFKFGSIGYGPTWKSTNGILQGCPISVMMLNILMSVWGARIDAINGNMRNILLAVEPQGYADDCCVTTTNPEDLKKAIEESKKFATKTGLLLAGEKCHLFVNDLADRTHLDGISASGNTLSVENNFNCLGVSIPVGERAKGGRDPKHIKKALDRTKRIGLLPVPRRIRPKIIHGFFASVWAYGSQFTNVNSRSDGKIQTETKKAAGYGAHMRCPEIVDTIFLKGHVVDPEQARSYRLVSNILKLLLKNDPNKDRAFRSWQKVRPGNRGLVAKTKNALDDLNIPWAVDGRNRSLFGEIERKEGAKREIFHTTRD